MWVLMSSASLSCSLVWVASWVQFWDFWAGDVVSANLCTDREREVRRSPFFLYSRVPSFLTQHALLRWCCKITIKLLRTHRAITKALWPNSRFAVRDNSVAKWRQVLWTRCKRNASWRSRLYPTSYIAVLCIAVFIRSSVFFTSSIGNVELFRALIRTRCSMSVLTGSCHCVW